ncbi:ATP-binding cassette domain-containing protein [Lactobacillus sp. CBA3606]|uniref:ABC transporter ATP-binding protein n=1 Tax=Lactobacillus sp. CBA3606 TaxID=2099789 RepID=UPI00351A7A4B
MQDLSYQVGTKQILKAINLTIPVGAHYTMTGPSGSGKSTLLRLMAAMISKTSGTLTFAGQPLMSYDPIEYRRQVSYCFQQPTLFGETVADNLAFPYQIRQRTPDWAHIKMALANVGLPTTMLTESVGTLSGGERQRIALIRNILFLPKILLLDEVTAGLDEANKAIIHQWLRQLNVEQQVTTIFVTHDVTEVAAADQLLRIVAGRLEDVK